MDNNNRGGFQKRGNFGGGFSTPYVPNAMDDRKLGLSAPPIEGAKMPASLRFTFPNGNPRGVADFGPGIPSIPAKMDMLDFFRLLEMVKKSIADKEENRWMMTLKAPAQQAPREDGGFAKKGPPELQSTIMVGRSDKGKLYISILSPDDSKPKVRFYFGQGYFSNISRKSGEPIPDSEISDLAATAWVSMYEKLIPAAHFATFKPREPKEAGAGGGGFRKEYPAKSQSSSQNDDSDIKKGDSAFFDDDIPY